MTPGTHRPAYRRQEFSEPLIDEVDLVLPGHEHHYERTVPVDGALYAVSGGGCKTTSVRPGTSPPPRSCLQLTDPAASISSELNIPKTFTASVGSAVGSAGHP